MKASQKTHLPRGPRPKPAPVERIPLNDLSKRMSPLVGDIEAAVRRVLHRGWFILGPEVQAFEEEFAALIGVESCVSVANGTDALELGLRGLGIGMGHHVATVANAGTYATTAILATGATPVLV